MCRWLAYSGAPILLDEVLFQPDHSLIDQSLRASDPSSTTNGDGFGIGWYGARDLPGVYKDIRPAWNDANLQALAAQIESSIFLAHVRATTGSPVQRTNCHPFNHENWLFVHNGLINGYDDLRRDLTFAIAPRLFPRIAGTTDSELMFLLALSFGLESDVKTGLERMAGLVEQLAETHEVENALQMTLGLSDGESLYAVRYSTEGKSRSLFHSASRDATMEIAPEAGRFSRQARAVVSEPLSDLEADWVAVPEASFLAITRGNISCEPFAPIAP
ncbi:MAG: class II glutamine amidotransferase [Woeseiaceae bacterium]|nr:class II glutamine amidotransferase [Woeseiaceae bacterium]